MKGKRIETPKLADRKKHWGVKVGTKHVREIVSATQTSHGMINASIIVEHGK